MKRIVFLYLIIFFVSAHLFGQKDLPVFNKYGECFLNAGKCNDVKIKDNIAYIGSEAGLLILDVSDPLNPEFINCYYTDRFVYKIFITDTLAFVTYNNIYDPMLSIIDISDIYNPLEIKTIELENGCQNLSIYLNGNYLFLGMDGGFNFYNIADLNEPQLVYHISDIDPMDIVVRDDYIYMVANYRYFGILDISTITEPELICWIGDYSTSRDAIDLQGDYAYVAGKTFDIFDISDPTNPQQVCVFETDWLHDLSVNENFCYAMSDDSLFVINIENPTTPEILGSYSYFGSCLSYENNLLAVTKDYNDYETPVGIGFFSVDDLQQISLANDFITDKAKEVFTEGNYAYVANGYNGMRIIDVADPTNPLTISDCLDGIYVAEIIVENDLAYVRSSTGLKIVDVNNPELPFTIGDYNHPVVSVDLSFSIEKYNNYVYIGGDAFWDLDVIDVSDPANPLYAGLIDVYDWSPDIEIFDEHLYVAGYWGGMQIFDLIDPVNPPMIGYHPLAIAIKIAVGENMAFVGGVVDPNSNGGIEIFDLSSINDPIHIGTYQSYGADMQCIENYLLVGNGSSIQVLDVADLSNPVLTQVIQNVVPNGIYHKNKKIYVAEDFKFKVFGDSISRGIYLNNGYQFVSSNLSPENPDMLEVLENNLNDNLNFVRNSQGQMLKKIGENWVNGIGDWISTEGYLFKMNEADVLSIDGLAVNPQTPIELNSGYQFVSYLPNETMNALEAFGSILNDDLYFIRNSDGKTIRRIGVTWVNGIGDCNHGEGFLIKMSEEGVLQYP